MIRLQPTYLEDLGRDLGELLGLYGIRLAAMGLDDLSKARTFRAVSELLRAAADEIAPPTTRQPSRAERRHPQRHGR